MDSSSSYLYKATHGGIHMTNIEKIKEAIGHLGEASYRQIRDDIIERYGPISESGYNADIISAAVNHTSRGHYAQNKKVRLANNPKYDFLFHTDNDTFVQYNPAKHGIWEMQKTEEGKFMPNKVSDDATLPPLSYAFTIKGQQFTFTTEDVKQAFNETSEDDWRDTPGRELYTHVVVNRESKPVKAVFRKLSGVPSDFDFTTHQASRAFKGLGFAIKDMRIHDLEPQLSLIGTWKGVVDEHDLVEKGIEQRGGWASWWSFPIEEEAQRLLTTPFYIYLNSGRDVFDTE